jgi:xylan 1,4-beta-xylosidase
VKLAHLLLVLFLLPAVAWCDEEIRIDAAAAHHLFPHFWEQMFGSGRAILSLRESYRSDLRAVREITDFKYMRFHAIFHDEVGVYDEDKQGRPVFNFSYVDQIYDGLLENGVRPFVELSFMPRKLAARNAIHSFKYHPSVSPPRDYAKWDALISAFAAHLIERYGIDEVAQWYFEVWNEPNLDFWAGSPSQSTYFDLYEHTSKALKAINSRLRVGGPSTAQAAWVTPFIRHMNEVHAPIDFVSTHVYANDTAENVFATREKIPRSEMVCRAAQKVRNEVRNSGSPALPIFWSEYNATYLNEPGVTDSAFMGPWLANTIRQCDGLSEIMSYWSFSDVFEEQGVVRHPFYGGYGLIAAGGIPKPAFNAFKVLHRLGHERLDVTSEHALVTRRADGSLVIALWNYVDPRQSGVASTITLLLPPGALPMAHLQRVDEQHGDVAGIYASMGAPASPTRTQLKQLQNAAALPPAQSVPIVNNQLSVTLPPNGLATVEIVFAQ